MLIKKGLGSGHLDAEAALEFLMNRSPVSRGDQLDRDRKSITGTHAFQCRHHQSSAAALAGHDQYHPKSKSIRVTAECGSIRFKYAQPVLLMAVIAIGNRGQRIPIRDGVLT